MKRLPLSREAIDSLLDLLGAIVAAVLIVLGLHIIFN